MDLQTPGGVKPTPPARVQRVRFRAVRYYWQAPNPPERDFGVHDNGELVDTVNISYTAGWTFLRRTALRNIAAVMERHDAEDTAHP
jgi:hypothetical protein